MKTQMESIKEKVLEINGKINNGMKNYLIKCGFVTIFIILFLTILITWLFCPDKLFQISSFVVALMSVLLMITIFFISTDSLEKNTQNQIDSFKENTDNQIQKLRELIEKQIETVAILEKVSEKFDVQIIIQQKTIAELKQVAMFQKETTDTQKETVGVLRTVSEKSDKQIEVQQKTIAELKQVAMFQKETTDTQKETVAELREVSKKSDEQIGYARQQLVETGAGNSQVIHQLQKGNEKLERNKTFAVTANEIGNKLADVAKEVGEDIGKAKKGFFKWVKNVTSMF